MDLQLASIDSHPDWCPQPLPCFHVHRQARERCIYSKANKTQLLTLGVDLSSYARKALVPALVSKVATAANVEWNKAPPKLLTGPTATVAPTAPPLLTAAAGEADRSGGQETNHEEPGEQPVPAEEPKSAEGTPTKPAEKCTCTTRGKSV